VCASLGLPRADGMLIWLAAGSATQLASDPEEGSASRPSADRARAVSPTTAVLGAGRATAALVSPASACARARVSQPHSPTTVVVIIFVTTM
jgi:hypothetical protein